MGLYYLQSRYYNPKVGRFLNADALVSTGQGVLGNNMFAYCSNNPVNYVDFTGAADRPVGAGIQIEASIGSAVVGVEVIVYWDSTVCNGGNPILAVYVYGGVSPEMGDIIQQAVVAMSCDDALLSGETQTITLSLSALTASLSNSYSLSVSAVLIVGNDLFDDITDYEGTFVSIGGSAKFLKGSFAYSDKCCAATLGGTLSSSTLSFGFSKTYYELYYDTVLGKTQTGTLGTGSNKSSIGGGSRWMVSYVALYY